MITLTILGALFVVFLMQMIFPGLTEAFMFYPDKALSQPWLFVTAIFLHANLTHLFFNSYALFLFGPLVERKMGKKEFLKIFFGSGILGSFLYWLTYVVGIIPPIPALGASGAIYGIMAAAAVLYPNLRIFMFFFPMRLREAVVVWFIISFIGTFDISSGIAAAAHLGGLIFGYLYAKDWVRKQVYEWWWI